jgi:hypothetical protein
MTSGTVSSSNLTSLYSNTTSFTAGVVNSSVYSVNGGLGVSVSPTTGNVVVNIGQDVSPASSVTFANVTATGNLSNGYYTLVNALGINGQVLTTNGAGTTTWTTPSSLGLVSSVSGSGAGISVSPTTGAVIVSNTGVTSIVAGSNIAISGGTGAVTISATGILGGDVVGPASSTDNAIVRFNGTTGKLIQNSTVTIADTTGNITTNGDIAVNGGDITTTQTTASIFSATATTVNAFGAANALNMGSFTGVTTLGNDLSMLGQTIKINTAGAAADNFIYFNNTNESLKWNQTDSRFEFSDQLYISQTDIPAILERRNVTADINTPLEFKSGLRLIQRVTDAPDNDTTSTGPGITFARTSGATATTERLFASLGAVWDGVTQTADYGFNWSDDNFAEPTPGNFPGTYILLQMGSNRAKFLNDSIYIDYDTAGAGKVGINKTASATYTLDVNGTTNSIGNLTVQAENITINDDKTNANVNLNFGRVAPSTNAVIRWNSATNIFEWSEDGTTWHQFIDATLTAPFYNGQMLTYRINSSAVGEWINDNRVSTTDATQRNVFEYRPLSPTAGYNTSLYLRKNYSNSVEGTPGVGTYADGAGVALSFQVNSDTQAPPGGVAGQSNNYASVIGIYSSTNPQIELRTSIDNGVTPRIVAEFDSNEANIGGTKLTLDNDNTGAGVNGIFAVNRGSTSATDAELTWDAGQVRWEFNNALEVQGQITGTSNLDLNGTNISLNSGYPTARDCNIVVDRGSSTDASIGWEEANNFWRITNNLFVNDYVIGGNGLATNGNNIYFNNENTDPSGDCFITVKAGGGIGINPNIKWNDTTNRWQTAVDNSTYLNIPNQNLDTTNDVNFASVIVDNITTYNSQTTTTTSTATVSISSTTRASQKSVIRIIDNVSGDIHMLEALAFEKGATAYLTTYAEMYTGAAALATFTADVSAGAIRILATPASSNSTTFTVARISLD